MTLFSFQLFNLYYKELISKNYYTVLDITSDSFYKFRENTRDVFFFFWKLKGCITKLKSITKS